MSKPGPEDLTLFLQKLLHLLSNFNVANFYLCSMRISYSVLMFFVSLISLSTFAQSSYSRLDDLYHFVERTDSLADKKLRSFSMEKFIDNDRNYRENWSYSENGGRVVFFQVDYRLDSTEFTEVYYVNRGSLVCSEEYEKVNYSIEEDELKYGSIYFFESTTPRHVVTLGRKTFNNRMLDPETMVFTRFEKRYSELKRHLPMLSR